MFFLFLRACFKFGFKKKCVCVDSERAKKGTGSVRWKKEEN